jgi:hypothetical protein
VITGYNTDVKHRNRVFHVQTEDKGDSNPFVESLVYVGGEILATRRVSYAELVAGGRDDQAVQELMEQQHRAMIASIQRGKFDGPNGGVRAPVEEPAPRPAEEPEEAAGRHRALGACRRRRRGTDRGGPDARPGHSRLPRLRDEPRRARGGGLGTGRNLRRPPGADETQGAIVGLSAARRRGVGPGPHPVDERQAGGRLSGKTAADGSCAVAFSVPAMRDGNAAAVVRVVSTVGSTEFKYPVKKA